MPPAAAPIGQPDRVAATPLLTPIVMQPSPSNAFANDAMIAWFKGEFAASNAIIDALCNHLTHLNNGSVPTEYESVFAAIHRRRLNWIPILQMQKYFSIDDIVVELHKVAANKAEMARQKNLINDHEDTKNDSVEKQITPMANENENDVEEVVDEDLYIDDSHANDITHSCSERTHLLERIEICSDHDNCEARRNQIKMTDGFAAKEPVGGQMVNIVKGLKLFENMFTNTKLSKLKDFVNELRVAGQNGELSGETFVLYNQNVKGNKRELIQFGVPIFRHVREDELSKYQKRKGHIEPIPALLRGVIEHLIQWRLISENRKPNGCIINFFDEGEYSQPFAKPPHLEQPIFILILSESKMAFGRTLVIDNEGNCRGPLILSLQEGSLLVMRGNSADTARHVMCASSTKRVSITFFKIQTKRENDMPLVPHLNRAISAYNDYNTISMFPKWGILPQPVIMFAPMSPTRVPLNGTGVFLPWKGSRKSTKHLPPRAQKGRLLSLPSPAEADRKPIVDEKEL